MDRHTWESERLVNTLPPHGSESGGSAFSSQFVSEKLNMRESQTYPEAAGSLIPSTVCICVCPAGPMGGVGMGVEGQWHYM